MSSFQTPTGHSADAGGPSATDLLEALLRLRRKRVADAPEYFAANQAAFDWITVAEWRLPDPGRARAMRDRLRQGGDFWELAQRSACEAIANDDPRAATTALLPTFRSCFRRELPPELAQVAWTVEIGRDVVGPICLLAPAHQDRYALYRVLGRREARLDRATLSAVERILLEQW
jgi:hypothetical protein